MYFKSKIRCSYVQHSFITKLFDADSQRKQLDKILELSHARCAETERSLERQLSEPMSADCYEACEEDENMDSLTMHCMSEMKRSARSTTKQMLFDIGLNAAKEMSDLIKTYSFEHSKSWCYQCDQECSHDPSPATKDGTRVLTCVVAGVSCDGLINAKSLLLLWLLLFLVVM
jgi:hypothetical protein